MAIPIGPKGHLEMVAPDIGGRRKVEFVSFKGLAAAGPIAGQHFPDNASKKGVKLVLDMNTGLNASAYFRDTGSGPGNLHIAQVDTGQGGNFDGHTMLAVISDTGT